MKQVCLKLHFIATKVGRVLISVPFSGKGSREVFCKLGSVEKQEMGFPRCLVTVILGICPVLWNCQYFTSSGSSETSYVFLWDLFHVQFSLISPKLITVMLNVHSLISLTCFSAVCARAEVVVCSLLHCLQVLSFISIRTILTCIKCWTCTSK